MRFRVGRFKDSGFRGFGFTVLGSGLWVLGSGVQRFRVERFWVHG
jgi:hypothetical protein